MNFRFRKPLLSLLVILLMFLPAVPSVCDEELLSFFVAHDGMSHNAVRSDLPEDSGDFLIDADCLKNHIHLLRLKPKAGVSPVLSPLSRLEVIRTLSGFSLCCAEESAVSFSDGVYQAELIPRQTLL